MLPAPSTATHRELDAQDTAFRPRLSLVLGTGLAGLINSGADQSIALAAWLGAAVTPSTTSAQTSDERTLAAWVVHHDHWPWRAPRARLRAPDLGTATPTSRTPRLYPYPPAPEPRPGPTPGCSLILRPPHVRVLLPSSSRGQCSHRGSFRNGGVRSQFALTPAVRTDGRIRCWPLLEADRNRGSRSLRWQPRLRVPSFLVDCHRRQRVIRPSREARPRQRSHRLSGQVLPKCFHRMTGDRYRPTRKGREPPYRLAIRLVGGDGLEPPTSCL
jgi:hypothetical protein